MISSFKLCRISGIDIRVHISWLIIAGLSVLSLGSYFAVTQPEWIPAIQLSAALLTSTLLFSSLIIHELGHSFVARYFGLQVRSITLFLFAGFLGNFSHLNKNSSSI